MLFYILLDCYCRARKGIQDDVKLQKVLSNYTWSLFLTSFPIYLRQF